MARWSIVGAFLLDPEGPARSDRSGAGSAPAAVQGGAPVTRVVIDGERIEAVLPSDARASEDSEGASARPDLDGLPEHDARGLYLAPGFIDLHFHGELLFAGPDSFAAALERASIALARHGTTSFLATTVAWGSDRLRAYVTRLAEIMTQVRPAGARPIGLHLEGPWINPKAAGAQPYEAGDEVILAACGDLLKMVTLAPEVAGAGQLVEILQKRCVIPALGHSQAAIDAAEDFFRRGMTHVTHLFNAMSGMHHRDPGLAGAVLGSREPVSCDLICDGVHVAPAVVRVAARCLGERLSLISDRIDLPPSWEAGRVAGQGAGDSGVEPGLQSDFGSGKLVDDGTAWRLASDGRLAGSRLTLDRAVRNARDFGAMDLLGSIAAVTLRPARLLGLEREIGTLRPGARADLVLLDAEGEVVETWVGGRRVHGGPGSSDSPRS
jgi:N-acetylglucosamine-6-phosphate deacetylase